MNRGLYISRTRRDDFVRAMKAKGKKVLRRTARGQRLHPMHIKDAMEEGVQYDIGFGNTDYLSSWPVLYVVEWDS